MNDFAIVECVDDKFVANLMCINSCNSIRKNVKNADFYLLLLKTNPFQEYYKQLRFNLMFIDEDFQKYFSVLDSHGWSKFVFTRFLIFKIDKFRKYSHVIYLDTDTYVAHDISQEIDQLSQCIDYLGMVRERRAYEYGNLVKLKQIVDKHFLHYEISNIYCNAGIIIFNSKVFSDENFNSILKLLEYHQEFPFNDQDIINLFFSKKITPIDPKYNLFSNTFYDSYFQTDNIQPNDQNVSIFHFAGYPDVNDKFQHSLQTFYNNSRDFLTL